MVASCCFFNSSRFSFHLRQEQFFLRHSLEDNDIIELCLLDRNFAEFDEALERLVSLTQTSETRFDSI